MFIYSFGWAIEGMAIRFLRDIFYLLRGSSKNSAFDRQPALSVEWFLRNPQIHANTRIANDSAESNNPSLRDLQSKSWQSKNSITTKILTLRNLFIVAFLSGVWHGAGWGFVIWGVLHGIAMVVHRIYSWFIDSLNANISSLRPMKSAWQSIKIKL